MGSVFSLRGHTAFPPRGHTAGSLCVETAGSLDPTVISSQAKYDSFRGDAPFRSGSAQPDPSRNYQLAPEQGYCEYPNNRAPP